MKRFILMIQFLTRIPIRFNLNVTEEDFLNGIIYFPLVGLIIGIFILAGYYVGLSLGGSFLAAVFAVIVEIIITGGLHLDGLADTFDGIYSNRPKDRVLEIMKDSRLGTNGALALFSVLITKMALINKIPIPYIYPILLLMPVASRLNIVIACKIGKTAKANGMGNLFIAKITNMQLIIAYVISIVLALLFPIAILCILIVNLFALWYVRHITLKIDGITGDILGSLIELSEIMFLLSYIIFFIFI
ncbi:adenosylcobinamide-GDP ribazoletransferase [Caminicella sporogenes]|uniref:adenosylcobinamide-GDP ribazoletransferase n=1 Tax=Caminicella sporogenes TaxID=166485 RepID=UPI0025419C55|nr:adenosylcobinamide-GDP ribazoletransferase [Caminicella sporogenes]WIF94966.1 adenosylcobinamide-GDP ribazoletransferase [Caminicella sporogenes]